MNRRTFFKTSVLTVGALPFASTHLRAADEPPAPAPRKFILSAPLTHSDWILKAGMVWGAVGVRHMLDACKACGWNKVHWRALDGGRSLYKSKLLRPGGKWDDDSFWNPQSDADKALFRRFTASLTDEKRDALHKQLDALDYSNFDSLAEAVRYGHQIGLQIHAWVTINEDDHGWGLQSDFSKKHPEFRWHGQNGKTYHSQLSFAFPEVRRYRLAILKELLANYELDGLFLDWIRTGDVRDNPQNDPAGIADYGYEKPLLERWQKKFGRKKVISNSDDAWIRMRAEPQTEFMREVRKLARKQKRPVPVTALVGHPWHYRGEVNKIAGNLRGLLLDLPAWALEGLVDSVVAAGYYRDGGNAELAAQALQKETAGKVEVWTYAWVPASIAEADQTFAVAEKVGAKEVLFWEADYIDDRSNAVELKAHLRQRAASLPARK